MQSEILDIRESNNQELENAGIITQSNYDKLYWLDVVHSDGMRENIYFGWLNVAGATSHAPYFEGFALEHYDMYLMARIERFAWRYRDQLLKGDDIRNVIKNDADNLLKIDIANIENIKTLVKEKRNIN